jgi:hypothetical protein
MHYFEVHVISSIYIVITCNVNGNAKYNNGLFLVQLFSLPDLTQHNINLSLHVHIDLLFILLEQRTIETLRRDIMLKRSFNITIIFSCFIYCVALYDVTGRNIWRISLLFFTDHCILFLYICVFFCCSSFVVCTMLPVSPNCLFLIVPSVISSIYIVITCNVNGNAKYNKPLTIITFLETNIVCIISRYTVSQLNILNLICVVQCETQNKIL